MTMRFHHGDCAISVNFPITEQDAVKMFRAIDLNNDNGLSYGEVVSVLEPPTLTSVNLKSKGEQQQLEALAGFLNFTASQAEVATNDPDGTLLAAALRHEAERQADLKTHGRGHTIEPGLAQGVKLGEDLGTGAVVRRPRSHHKLLTKHERAVWKAEQRAKAVDPTPWVLEATKQTFPSECVHSSPALRIPPLADHACVRVTQTSSIGSNPAASRRAGHVESRVGRR